ncbi:Exodeoxyribonuclease 7 large subunit (Exodeoxyribonuclease VII large subunit) (Exonuclease VII large subunit) [Candidatus Methylomirabilis lanthanidiphila]|uniref:Exodeoxyribonuclease 7 large subunit n=1 Tax=Candidatus Methylomirabilis lanthanidiphila TaxID=2211376 RepID=A0A564ZIL7_9BACT|nr:exodeoxyribonuclease VII large subunit [Candidatus Methylomirabilis lanthanidiphila]VUZ84936.1 Exodeoxyribonuclease 7 large subunit (Exodeoxyribonuclease VII large subunit) (Exonuclease VII large subunit) [Candidatus Methylomirabilis lanthanidiphila]
MTALQPPKIYTVSDLTAEIRALLEDSFSGIWVQGELSNVHQHSSGHMYFSLKDEESQIRAVMFRMQNRQLRFQPKDGLAVLVHGALSVYERRGDYQIVAEYMEPKGLGALQLAFEQLKDKLRAEGLFDDARKRPIPLLPRRIGVITSPTGAAIRDILHVLRRRFVGVDVLIYPATVQGDQAATQIVEALGELNRRGGLDVVIIARGGGSIEDLQAFNEETVARAIAASRIPVISGIGHEVDYTIADFVADLRAPTPSAAAELVIAKQDELAQRLDDLQARMTGVMRSRLHGLRVRMSGLDRHLRLLNPVERVQIQRRRLTELVKDLTGWTDRRLALLQGELKAVVGKLDSLSPLAILSRGYSICLRVSDQEIVKDSSVVVAGDLVEVRLHRGRLRCDVREVQRQEG